MRGTPHGTIHALLEVLASLAVLALAEEDEASAGITKCFTYGKSSSPPWTLFVIF